MGITKTVVRYTITEENMNKTADSVSIKEKQLPAVFKNGLDGQDFANTDAEIKTAFEPYYEQTN